MDYQDYLNERRAKQFPDIVLDIKTPEEAGITAEEKVEKPKKKTNKKG